MQQGPLLDPRYSYRNGIFCYKGKIVITSSASLRNDLIKKFHGTPLRGHDGISKAFMRLSAKFV